MHRIERYGVIALVFLLATIAAVVWWGDGTASGAPVGVVPVLDRSDTSGELAVAARPAPRSQPETPEQRRALREEQRRRDEEKRARNLPMSERPDPALTPAPLATAMGARALEQGGVDGLQGVPLAPRSLPGVVRDDARTREAEARARRSAALPNSDVAAAGTSAAPTKQAPERFAAGARRYVVQPGDVLGVICQRELGTVKRLAELKRLNGLENADAIFAGQVLELPGDAASAAAARSAAPVLAAAPAQRAPASTATTASGARHVVQKGESLGVICQRRLGSVKQLGMLMALNGIEDADRIFVGQELVLPAEARPLREASVASADRGTTERPTRASRLPDLAIAQRPAGSNGGANSGPRVR